MEEAKVGVIADKKVVVSTQLLSMVVLAVLFPLFPLQQITGPLVNALLFIAVVILGVRNALLICFLPSIMSVSVGILPLVMLPVVPVIIIGNILLVLLFNYFNKKNFWLGVVIASFVKFIFIYSLATLLATEFIKSPMFAKVVGLSMGYLQLVSALAGGIIAWVFLKFIKRI
jgi:hypothetical protein